MKGRMTVDPQGRKSIAPEEFLERQGASRQKTAERGMDALVVIGGPFYDRPGDLAYLTGHYPPFPSVNYEGDYRGLGFGVFILPVSGSNVLVSDTASYRKERVVANEIRPTRNVPMAVREVLKELGLSTGRVALIGGQVAPWAFINEMTKGLSVELNSSDEILRVLRRHKSPAEIALLRQAARVAEIGMAAALASVEPGRTEAEVCAAGIQAGIAAGADFVRYLRVLSGPFSGWPHRWPPATSRVLNAGETVCLDYIGAVNGYQFDILRSTVVGKGSPETQHLLEIASDATEAAIAACGPGVPVREVVGAADRVLQRGGYLEHRAGFTGHGIGLETVETPLIMADSDEYLAVGDVVCLEPGILVRDSKGARFEYEIVITPRGREVLARPS